MQLDRFYDSQLVILGGVCAAAFAIERYVSKGTKRGAGKESADDRLETGKSALSGLMRKYLLVYALVMGADWLQGPYVYSLYREQYQFPERMVAVFFVTGFLSAGIAAPMVGAWADEHGRRKLCLVFCITYTLSCIAILFPSPPILFLGRLLGGFSTSILFSAFESWLISSANSSALPSADLSTIMGRATLVNGLVATTAGVVSNQLVSMSGNFVAPFVASAALLMLAWVVIKGSWMENYGTKGASSDGDMFQVKRLGQAWNIVRKDPLLLVLGLTQTCFEGSMYLFVFLWVPSLQEHTIYAHLPFGYIFSSFMISMMLGSLLYTFILAAHQRAQGPASALLNGSSNGNGHGHTNGHGSSASKGDSSLTLHAKLSSLVCAAAALALATSVRSRDERVRFWAFCVFEACVGMYYPVQGTLRGTLISNEHRATLSSLFRVPLNIFVVVSLLTGVSDARTGVLSASALMLAFSSLMTGWVIVGRVDG